MKTSILDDIEIPEDRRAVLAREALRQLKPLKQLIKEMLLEKSDALIAAAQGQGQTSAKRTAAA
jgi:predicted HAD superfamily phosphohydrolase